MATCRRKAARVLQLVLVGWLAAVAANAQEPDGRIQIAGTRVSLVPPPGFTTAANFPGIVHEPTGSAVAVTEAPTPFAISAMGLSAERLAAAGMTILERREVAFEGLKGHLLRLRQVSKVAIMTRWIAVTGNETTTVFIEPGGEKRLAERWVTLIDGISDPVIQSGEYVTVGGLTGYQLVAQAREKRVWQPVVVYQLLLFHEHTIYRVLGFTRPAERQGNIELFKSVASTFRLAPK